MAITTRKTIILILDGIIFLINETTTLATESTTKTESAITTAGFNCYSREVFENINFNKIKFSGYGFQIEMKFRVWKMGFKIKEIPIIFRDRERGKSKISGGIIWEGVIGVFGLLLRSLIFRKEFKRKIK